jgi:hypothetical protein
MLLFAGRINVFISASVALCTLPFEKMSAWNVFFVVRKLAVKT